MKNKYYHKIDLKKVEIKNTFRDTFRELLKNLEYRGYEVESLDDGRKIVITKPGGKRATYGQPMKDDFLVFIHNVKDDSLWQITHKQILEDLYEKSKEDSHLTLKLIDFLERTFKGEEPNDFLNDIRALVFKTGETAETLIKVYKWIWGQEDVNYPNHKGRYMSWEGIEELKEELK